MRTHLTLRELNELRLTLCSRLDVKPGEVSEILVKDDSVAIVRRIPGAKPVKGVYPVETVLVPIVIDPDAESVADGASGHAKA